MAQLPAIQATRKSGKECFEGIGGEHTLQDFWAWAFSDLVSNTERGKLAEYLVAKAMGCGTQISQTWESYDLLSPEGIKIEVKTSAYSIMEAEGVLEDFFWYRQDKILGWS